MIIHPCCHHHHHHQHHQRWLLVWVYSMHQKRVLSLYQPEELPLLLLLLLLLSNLSIPWQACQVVGSLLTALKEVCGLCVFFAKNFIILFFVNDFSLRTDLDQVSFPLLARVIEISEMAADGRGTISSEFILSKNSYICTCNISIIFTQPNLVLCPFLSVSSYIRTRLCT